MSEKILKALLQLFAIIARTEGQADGHGLRGRDILERFLRQQFDNTTAAEHLARFDSFMNAFHHGGGVRQQKRTSVNSVKVLKICMEINEELNQRQKYVVLVHLLEFIHASSDALPQELEFVATVAETFHIHPDDYRRCLDFVQRPEARMDEAFMLYIDAAASGSTQQAKHLHAHGLHGELRVLRIPSVDIYVARYQGQDRVLLNGQPMDQRHHYVLANGTSIRPPGGVPIYYSDILGSFNAGAQGPRLSFKADGITYTFPNERVGLHDLHLAETSGKLIGIMGGSGSGKSTLLSVLNGTLKPTTGRVTINGIDVHLEADRIRGVIGHVSQDDLLIEELTVFQNLFYNAKLCFGDKNDEQVTERVMRLLHTLGLYETRDLKVGSVLDKTISGGQRKRLNIALELIREPSVLFVDEPTSGLSSRDSENIMDLLKELALKGRLVFVVIHQPSSDIFKLFDRLLLMDQEGYPVYYGDPVDAVVYFKQVTGQVNSEVGHCAACGNVNPEQIFNILEARMVDEHGFETDQRRIGPEAWNEVFRARMEPRVARQADPRIVPASTFRRPTFMRQLEVFFKRDVLAKLANRQYVLINLLEAPVLAFIMAFFLRYQRSGETYLFRTNENIPQFLFISVIMALFLGLTVAAEEIIRDRRILQREKFLDLSRSGYLLSKIMILFLISAIQMALFVWVSRMILGFEGLAFTQWAILFSTACFANVLGLNVSAAFNSAKVIYIVIPVLIIPQLLFSGIIVKFDKLHPWFADQKGVPLIGNIMASRWAYEGLAVLQYMENEYERSFYAYDLRMKTANWKKDLWVRELKTRVEEIRLSGTRDTDPEQAANMALLRHELGQEMRDLRGFRVADLDRLNPEEVDEQLLMAIDEALNILTTHYRTVYRKAEQEKEALIMRMTATPEGRANYFELLDKYRNDGLADIVTNKNDLEMITAYRGELVRKSDPIYLEPVNRGFFEAQFYAPAKYLMGTRWSTASANMAVLWLMALLFAISLRTNAIPTVTNRLARPVKALRRS
ncbi:MAG: ATP-binding cassette domain-containing protein [Flavobacteriales bacterium]|nr:ATP-binding cassette domain-containing protein [Flavobacteriales bacterium]